MQEGDIQKIAKFISRDGLIWNAIKILYHTPERIHAYRRRITKNGIFFRDQELESASLAPTSTIDVAIKLFHPKSVLDIGSSNWKPIARRASACPSS
jgi:hypothetical protein